MPATADSTETDHLLQMIAEGDRDALGSLIARHREYLRRVVDARMEPGLRQKLDPCIRKPSRWPANASMTF